MFNDYGGNNMNNALILQLFEKSSVIVVAAYFFSQAAIFQNLLKEQLSFGDKLIMISFFSLLSIMGTYMGINVNPGALANIRPIGAIMAGYMGGPFVGVSVGLLAGLDRYYLGGFTAVSCGLSTIAEGLIGALSKKIFKDNLFNVKIGFFTGVAAEICQMLIILILSKPFSQALVLERAIALPMIIVNSAGVAIFINIIKNSNQRYSEISAVQFQRFLNISNKTIQNMKNGLTVEAAQKISDSIFEFKDINGIFISSNSKVLAYRGEKIDLGTINYALCTLKEFSQGEIIKIENNFEVILFFCVPLRSGDSCYEGFLGIRITGLNYADEYIKKLTVGIAELLSKQLEVYRLNEIASKSEAMQFNVLKSQIHPHFLFNSLNTISSFCRTDPSKAKELIINLADYFRSTLKSDLDFNTVSDEIDLINSYVSLQKARFGNRLNVVIDVPEEIMPCSIPHFLLQPLVGNAIKHGISFKSGGGTVYVKGEVKGNEWIEFTVEDTGIGMTPERLSEVINSNCGIGIGNIRDRIYMIYGNKCSITINSNFGQGTTVTIKIPKGEIA